MAKHLCLVHIIVFHADVLYKCEPLYIGKTVSACTNDIYTYLFLGYTVSAKHAICYLPAADKLILSNPQNGALLLFSLPYCKQKYFFHIRFIHNNFILSLPSSHRVRKQNGASETLTLQLMKMYVRFEVFMVVTTKNAVFWDVVPCRFIINRCFRGMCCLHHQGKRNSADYSLEALKALIITLERGGGGVGCNKNNHFSVG
jgi:hypothetical protein